MQPNDITFFSTFPRMTFWLGVKPSPSATSLNRTSKRVMCFVSGVLKMTVIFCTIEVTATSTVTLDTLTEKTCRAGKYDPD